MNSFVRPINFSIPQIYYTFKAKNKNSDEIVEYRVKDLIAEHFEIAIRLLVNNFLPDETICSSKGMANKIPFVNAVSEFWRETLKNHLSIGCYQNDDLVGVNVLIVKSIHDPKEDTKVDESDFGDMLEVLGYAANQTNTFNKYGVDQYLTAYGLCVHRDYRGRNIATEMLKSRIPIMKALGLKVTTTSFTGIGSQIAAAKANYKEDYVISYQEIEKLFPKFDFSASKTTHLKIMSLTI